MKTTATQTLQKSSPNDEFNSTSTLPITVCCDANRKLSEHPNILVYCHARLHFEKFHLNVFIDFTFIDTIDTSSDDDDDADFLQNPNDELPNNGASTSSAHIASTSLPRSTHRSSFPCYTTSTKPVKYDHHSHTRRTIKPHLARAAAIIAKQSVSSVSDDDDDDDIDEITPPFLSNVAVPSTSTGITVPTGPIFRAQLQFYDSEEEDDDAATSGQRTSSRAESMVNLVPVIPMPLNGTHNFDASCSSVEDAHIVNVMDAQHGANAISSSDNNHSSDGGASTVVAEVTALSQFVQNANRKRNARLLNSNYANYSSHSNSRLSSSSTTDIEDSSNHKRPRLLDNTPNKSRPRVVLHTPINRCTTTTQQDFTPDSGFLTNITTTSSTSNSFLHNSTDSCSNGEGSKSTDYPPGTSSSACDPVVASTSSATSYGLRLFQKKISRMRRNYRNTICDDSDSE